jgi:hypothetical protein
MREWFPLGRGRFFEERGQHDPSLRRESPGFFLVAGENRESALGTIEILSKIFF